MTKDKQIEEMALDIHKEGSFGLELSATLAEGLTAKGYRKASDLASEIFEEIEKEAEIGRIMNACAIVSLDAIAELKKKYTEEQ